jgi:hypothetical protein
MIQRTEKLKDDVWERKIRRVKISLTPEPVSSRR